MISFSFAKGDAPAAHSEGGISTDLETDCHCSTKTGPLNSQAKSLNLISCKADYAAHACDDFYKKNDIPECKDFNEKSLIPDCKRRSCEAENPQGDSDVAEAHTARDYLVACAHGFVEFKFGLSEESNEELTQEKWLTDCKSIECKYNLIGPYKDAVDKEGHKIFPKELIEGHPDPKVDCNDVVNQTYCYGTTATNLFRRLSAHIEFLEGERKGTDPWMIPWTGKTFQQTEKEAADEKKKNAGKSFSQRVTDQVNNWDDHVACYNQYYRNEIRCYAAFAVIDIATSAAWALKAAHILKLLKGAKALTRVGKVTKVTKVAEAETTSAPLTESSTTTKISEVEKPQLNPDASTDVANSVPSQKNESAPTAAENFSAKLPAKKVKKQKQVKRQTTKSAPSSQANIVGTDVDPSSPLARLKELMDHKITIKNGRGYVKIGDLNDGSADKKFMLSLMEAIKAGQVAEIDAGAVIGPKVLALLAKLSKSVPRGVSVEIRGQLSIGYLVQKRAWELQAVGSEIPKDGEPYDRAVIWTNKDQNNFDKAVDDLKIRDACKEIYKSTDLINCRRMIFQMDLAHPEDIRWSATSSETWRRDLDQLPSLPPTPNSVGASTVPRYRAPRTTNTREADTASAAKLREFLALESATSHGSNVAGSKVYAVGEIRGKGQVFSDVNQKARGAGLASSDVKTDVPEFVIAPRAQKFSKNGQSDGRVNSNMNNAHAELGVLTQAQKTGLTKDAEMELHVAGKDVCPICEEDLPYAACNAGLKRLKIVSSVSTQVLYWERGEGDCSSPGHLGTARPATWPSDW